MKYGKKYWSTVCARACAIQDLEPKIYPVASYWLARNQVDAEIVERDKQLELLDQVYAGASK